jgi:hypothetical protein
LVGEGTSWQTTCASALAFIQIQLADGRTKWGASMHTNVELAAIKAVLGAMNLAG